jgi:hypothetical protein
MKKAKGVLRAEDVLSESPVHFSAGYKIAIDDAGLMATSVQTRGLGNPVTQWSIIALLLIAIAVLGMLYLDDDLLRWSFVGITAATAFLGYAWAFLESSSARDMVLRVPKSPRVLVKAGGSASGATESSQTSPGESSSEPVRSIIVVSFGVGRGKSSFPVWQLQLETRLGPVLLAESDRSLRKLAKALGAYWNVPVVYKLVDACIMDVPEYQALQRRVPDYRIEVTESSSGRTDTYTVS